MWKVQVSEKNIVRLCLKPLSKKHSLKPGTAELLWEDWPSRRPWLYQLRNQGPGNQRFTSLRDAVCWSSVLPRLPPPQSRTSECPRAAAGSCPDDIRVPRPRVSFAPQTREHQEKRTNTIKTKEIRKSYFNFLFKSSKSIIFIQT